MIMDPPDETQQISVDSQGNPVYAGAGYWLYGLTFVGLLIVSIVLYKVRKRTPKQQ